MIVDLIKLFVVWEQSGHRDWILVRFPCQQAFDRGRLCQSSRPDKDDLPDAVIQSGVDNSANVRAVLVIEPRCLPAFRIADVFGEPGVRTLRPSRLPSTGDSFLEGLQVVTAKVHSVSPSTSSCSHFSTSASSRRSPFCSGLASLSDFCWSSGT